MNLIKATTKKQKIKEEIIADLGEYDKTVWEAIKVASISYFLYGFLISAGIAILIFGIWIKATFLIGAISVMIAFVAAAVIINSHSMFKKAKKRTN